MNYNKKKILLIGGKNINYVKSRLRCFSKYKKRDTLKYNQVIKINDLFKLIKETYNKNHGFYIQFKNENVFFKIDKYRVI